MNKRTVNLLIMVMVLSACKPVIATTQPIPSSYPVSTSTSTPYPSQTSIATAKPTQTSTPTFTPNASPTPEASVVLEQVSQLGGSINGITVVGDVAYVGMGPRVTAIDIRDHQNPQLIMQSEPLPGLVTEIVQVSQGGAPLLVANAGKYLLLLDTSTPGEIKPISQLELQGEITAMVWDATVSTLYAGGSVYQAPMSLGYTGFVSAVDVTLDKRLKPASSVMMPARVLSLALGDGGLFAGGEGQETGLYHIQVKTPLELDTPHLVIASTPEEPLHPTHMQVIGERLYLGYRAIEAYDISDPDHPTRTWRVNTDIVVDGFNVVGNQIIAFGWTILTEYKIDTVSVPEPIEGSPLGIIAADTAMHNGDLLVAYNDLEIYDATNPKAPQLVGSYQAAVIHAIDAAANESAVFVVDNGLGASNSGVTLRGFDLPDLTPLGQVESELPTWYSYVGMALEGDRVYIAGENGLWVYDVSSSQPSLLGEVKVDEGEIFAFAAMNNGGRRLLVIGQVTEDHSGALSAYDLTDWQHPVKMGESLTIDQGNILQMTWNGTSLFVLLDRSYFANNDMLYAIEIENDSLAVKASIEVTGYIEHMAVGENIIVLAGIDGDMGESFISVVETEPLRIVAKVTLPEIGMGLSMIKDKALVVVGGQYGAAQFLAFDLQDPPNPRQVNAVDIAVSSGTRGVTIISSPYIILANGAGGVEVWDYSISVIGSFACLDQQVKPQAVTPGEQPLEVRFISDGNIWEWVEGMPARQISDTGDALRFTFSPDGEVAAFERTIGSYPYDYKIELWAANRDGSDLRRLVSAEQFDQFLPRRDEAWMANLPEDYRWFSGTHELSFGVYAFINAVGGSYAAQGYWMVNADSLALERWDHPEAINPYGPIEIPSPDGKLIALVDMESISLLNGDGKIIQKNAFTYPGYRYLEGPGWGAPEVVWSPDSQSLKVVVWDEDFFDAAFNSWEVPADGGPAKKLHTFDGLEYFASISPNQEYIAYLHRVQPMSNDNELHLVRFDGSDDIIYAEGYQLEFLAWAPDSFHFAYDLFSTHQPLLGSLCDVPVGLVNTSETPATQITWVDGDRYLFVSGQDSQMRELRLGQVGGESEPIGSLNGDGAYYQVRQEGQDVIVP